MSKNEFQRKIFHLILGLLILWLYGEGVVKAWMLLCVLILGALVSFIHHKRRIPLVHWFLVRFDREEMIPGRGALTFMLGMTLAAFAFPKAFALAGMAALTVADAAGALIGIAFGRMQNPLNKDKTVEGSLGVLVASFCAAWPFVGVLPAYVVAFVTMFVEAAARRDVGSAWHILLDDNVLVPAAVGVVLLVLQAV